MTKSRRQLSKWLQHKPALRHPRMRYFQARGVNDDAAKQHNIEIDDPWAARDQTPAAHLLFNLEQAGQQLAREQGRFRFHHLIEKPGLVEKLARFGFVNR